MELIVAGPAKQRRLTVAFRLILAIPHGFVLVFLNLAGFVVAVLGWWGALFMGRLPAFAATYLSGLARWNTRFYGYLYLLTDVYPPFEFEGDPAYPVVIAIPPPARLNRFAVFFRFILIIWANIVAGLVIYGTSTIVAFIAWLITLITGKLPAPLHLAFTAVVRFRTRYNCYLFMLTSTYPWKLFGDEPDASAPVTAAPAEAATPAESAWGTRPADWAPPAYGTPRAYGIPPAYGTPPACGRRRTRIRHHPGLRHFRLRLRPAVRLRQRPVRLPARQLAVILPQSAKTLLIVFIVLGLITVGCQFWSVGRLTSQFGRIVTIGRWDTANDEFVANMTRWETAIQACPQNDVGCLAQADGQAALSVSVFASQIQATSMPTAVAPDAAQVVADATKVAQDLTELSQTTTLTQYNTEYASTSFADDLASLYSDIDGTSSAL